MKTNLTILTAPKRKLCKQIFKDADGQVKKRPYDHAKYFDASETSVASIDELYDFLLEEAEQADSCLIRGRLREDVDASCKVARRLSRGRSADPNEEAIEDQPCQWIMIDVDKLILPAELTITTEPISSVAHVISLLPDEFCDKSCVWQLSASCALEDPHVFSAHLFFWLSNPIANEHLRAWAVAVNTQAGIKLIDPALFNATQIHYTSNPIFHDVEDPIKAERIGLLRGKSDEVSLNITEATQIGYSSYKGEAAGISDVGYEGKMAYLGDASGSHGFNNVLLSATAAFVAVKTKEQALAQFDSLKADVRRRIDEADQSSHSQTEIARYKSDAYLDPLILGAIEKFSDQTPPYWDVPLLTLAEGEKRLRNVIDDFGRQSIDFLVNPLEHEMPVLAVRATAGLGKTHSVIKQLLAYKLLEHGDVHYYVPNHRLSRELEAEMDAELTLDLPEQGAVLKRARVIYGRAQDAENGLPMCRKASIAAAISDAGGSVYKSLCKNRSGQCEFFESCAYLEQLDDVKELPEDIMPVLTEVKIMPHNHLFYTTKEHFFRPSLVVIDESFIRTPHTEVTLPITDIMSFADPNSHIAALAGMLARGTENLLGQLRARCTSHELLEELEDYEDLHSSAFPSLKIDDSLAEQELALQDLQSNRTPILVRTLAREMQMTDRNESNAVLSDGQEVTVLRRKDIYLPDAPLLIIDADANPLLLKPFIEGPIRVEDIRVERQAEVYQFSDKTFSATALKDNPELMHQISHFISGVAETGRTLVVSSKRVEESLSDMDIGTATLDHFNNLRGVNLYSGFENIIIVGRNQPSSIDVEKLARGLWFDADEPFALLEEKSGSRPLGTEKRGYRLKQDHDSAMTQVHPDWRVQALLEQIRESESTQAIDRLRLLRSHPEGVQRRVFILCSVPLDVTVDHLESWSGLQKLIALLEDCKGVVPLNPKHLMIASTAALAEGTAKDRIKDFKRMKTLISISIRESILLTAQYRLRGQKRPGEVLYDANYSAEQVQARLSEIAGEPVEML